MTDVMSQQQLAQPLPGAHQITTNRLTRPNDITERFLLASRHANRVKPIDHQQAQHPLGVALIGLDLVPAGRSIFPGAATTHPTSAVRSDRAKP